MKSRGHGRSQNTVSPRGVVSPRRNAPAKTNTLIVGVSLAAAVGWILLMSLWLRSLLMSPPEKPPSLRVPAKIVMENVNVSPIDVWPDNTETIDLFRTLKECDPTVPGSKCLQHVPEGTTTHRVAILSPPGEQADFLAAWIKSVVQFHSKDDTDIVLLPTSHVPPYGYGRNHGYTKIIRIASFPMSLAAADTARSASETGAKDVGLNDMKEVTRQITRWHCRLSHVAAHTAMLTITMEDLIEDPYEIEEKLCSFLGLTKRDPEVDGLEEGHMDEDELMGSMDPILDHVSDLLNQVDRASGTENMESVLNSVVAEELEATNDLKAWPCLSFWDVGEDPKPSELTPIARRVAQALSPDCKAEHTTCSVNKDKCEERGDPVCK